MRKRRAQWEQEFRAQTEIKHFGLFVAMKRKAARAAKQAAELARLMVIEKQKQVQAKNKEAARALEKYLANNPETTVYT